MNIIKRIKASDKRFRIIVYHDQTYKRLRAFKLSKMNIIILIAFFTIGIIGLSYLALAYTPAKHIIPGYPSEQIQKQIAYNSIKLDSLEFELKLKDQYISNIKSIISGDTVHNNLGKSNKEAIRHQTGITFDQSNYDSLIRQQITNQNDYQTNFSTVSAGTRDFTNLHFYTPLEGLITNGFNREKKHYGIDIVSSPDKVVSAVLGGTVTMATWSVETGYIIQIQHSHNLISVYKHNARLLKEEGSYVRGGEPISVVGNSGELTTGPHLHFELWYRGRPLDPEDYITF